MKRDSVKKNLKNKLIGLFGIVFGRTAFVVLSILVQILILVAFLNWFSDYILLVYSGFTVLAIIGVVIIFNREVNADYKLAWMLPIVIAPVFGALFYLMMSLQYGTRYIEERLIAQKPAIKKVLQQNSEMMQVLKAYPNETGFANYMYHYAGAPVFGNSAVTYFPLGEDKFYELILQLKKAKKFIFMEYFIVSRGYMWDTILEILKAKVKEGVEVRFMYDGMCSLVLLPYNYPKELSRYGIKSKMFSPIRPVLSTHQNNRDHRKIVVIDGHTAFTGGINLADEYINRTVRFGHWKDTSVMVKGDAVKTFTMMFLQMWNVDEKNAEDYGKYVADDAAKEVETALSQPTACQYGTGGAVIPYGDEPFDNEAVGKCVYLDILNRAKEYVHIMTPYLILDDEMKEALIYSAKRGVETVIIMPHIPDKKYAYYLARSYYPELLANGVQIYEYTPGFVHAKVFVSDHARATVGSVNMDYRSLYLHFECGLYIWKNSVIEDIDADFDNTLAKCQQITVQNQKEYSLWKKIMGRALRLIAPLM